MPGHYGYVPLYFCLSYVSTDNYFSRKMQFYMLMCLFIFSYIHNTHIHT